MRPNETSVTDPRVTVVVTQRERFSMTRETLPNIYDSTRMPFELIYVTGGLSGRRRRELEAEARRRGFRHIEAGRALTPAESRNIGAANARTEFVVFIENDTVIQEGTVEALVGCAEETGADVVTPVTCEQRPVHQIIHHVGREMQSQAFIDGPEGERDFDELYYLQGKTRDEVADQLVRRRTQDCEFHCFLARRSLFDRIGYFDPDIVSKETLHFCWTVSRAGGDIWLEPGAVATFLIPSDDDPVSLADLPDFLLRWSAQWQRRSHDKLQAHWGLSDDGFIAKRKTMEHWRIDHHVLKPALRKVPVLGRRWGFVERAARRIYPPVAVVVSLLVWRYDRARRRAAGMGDLLAQG